MARLYSASTDIPTLSPSTPLLSLIQRIDNEHDVFTSTPISWSPSSTDPSFQQQHTPSLTALTSPSVAQGLFVLHTRPSSTLDDSSVPISPVFKPLFIAESSGVSNNLSRKSHDITSSITFTSGFSESLNSGLSVSSWDYSGDSASKSSLLEPSEYSRFSKTTVSTRERVQIHSSFPNGDEDSILTARDISLSDYDNLEHDSKPIFGSTASVILSTDYEDLVATNDLLQLQGSVRAESEKIEKTSLLSIIKRKATDSLHGPFVLSSSELYNNINSDPFTDLVTTTGFDPDNTPFVVVNNNDIKDSHSYIVSFGFATPSVDPSGFETVSPYAVTSSLTENTTEYFQNTSELSTSSIHDNFNRSGVFSSNYQDQGNILTSSVDNDLNNSNIYVTQTPLEFSSSTFNSHVTVSPTESVFSDWPALSHVTVSPTTSVFSDRPVLSHVTVSPTPSEFYHRPSSSRVTQKDEKTTATPHEHLTSFVESNTNNSLITQIQSTYSFPFGSPTPAFGYSTHYSSYLSSEVNLTPNPTLVQDLQSGFVSSITSSSRSIKDSSNRFSTIALTEEKNQTQASIPPLCVSDKEHCRKMSTTTLDNSFTDQLMDITPTLTTEITEVPSNNQTLQSYSPTASSFSQTVQVEPLSESYTDYLDTQTNDVADRITISPSPSSSSSSLLSSSSQSLVLRQSPSNSLSSSSSSSLSSSHSPPASFIASSSSSSSSSLSTSSLPPLHSSSTIQPTPTSHLPPLQPMPSSTVDNNTNIHSNSPIPPPPPPSSSSSSSSIPTTPAISPTSTTPIESLPSSTPSQLDTASPHHTPAFHPTYEDHGPVSKPPPHHTSDITIPMVTSITTTTVMTSGTSHNNFTTMITGKVDSTTDDGFMSGTGPIIIGSVCGALAVVIVVVVAIIWCATKRKGKKKSKVQDNVGDDLWVDMNSMDRRYRLPSPSLMTLPTLEDENTITGGNDNIIYYKALHDYQSLQDGHLSLAKGDEVQLLETADNGWCRGTSKKDGMSGWFPNSYVIEAQEYNKEWDNKDTDLLTDKNSKGLHGHISSFQIKKNDRGKTTPIALDNETSSYASLERKGGNPDVACWVKMANSVSMSSIPSVDNAPVNSVLNECNNPNTNGLHYRAIYSYKPVCKGEMSLKEGELVVCKEKDKNGWMLGLKPQTKEEGWFPAVYVDEASIEGDPMGDIDVPPTYEILESNTLHNTSQPWTGIEHKSLLSYTSEISGDLNFTAGEVIFVYQTLANGWWFGAKGELSGWFPGSFVEIIPKEENEGDKEEQRKQGEDASATTSTTSPQSVQYSPSLDEIKVALRTSNPLSLDINNISSNSLPTSAVNSPRDSVASSIYSENDKIPLMSHNPNGGIGNKMSSKNIRPCRKAPAPPVTALKPKLAANVDGTDSLRRPARPAPAPPPAQKNEKTTNNNDDSDKVQKDSPEKVYKKPVVRINGRIPKLVKTLPTSFDDKCLNPMIRPAKRGFAPTPAKYEEDRKHNRLSPNPTPTSTVTYENSVNSVSEYCGYSPKISKKSYLEDHIRNKSPTSSVDSGMDVKMQRPFTPTSRHSPARSFTEFDRLTTPEREQTPISLNRSRSSTPTAFHRLTPRHGKPQKLLSPLYVPSSNGLITSLTNGVPKDKDSDNHHDSDPVLNTTLTQEDVKIDETPPDKPLFSTFLSPNTAQPKSNPTTKDFPSNSIGRGTKLPKNMAENEDTIEIHTRKPSFSRAKNGDDPPARESLNLTPGTVSGMVDQINRLSPNVHPHPALNRSTESMGSFVPRKKSPISTPSPSSKSRSNNNNSIEDSNNECNRSSPDLPPLENENDKLLKNTFRPISVNSDLSEPEIQSKPISDDHETELDNFSTDSLQSSKSTDKTQNGDAYNSYPQRTDPPTFHVIGDETTTAL